MQKVIILLILCLLTISCRKTKNTSEDLAKPGVKVKQVLRIGPIPISWDNIDTSRQGWVKVDLPGIDTPKKDWTLEGLKGKIKSWQCTTKSGGEKANYEPRYNYHLDKAGKLIKKTMYDLYTKKIERYGIYKYDQRGNLIEEKVYNPDSTVWDQYNYSYDTKNRLIKETSIPNEGACSYEDAYTIIYRYNDQNNTIIKTWYFAGLISWKFIFKYDNYGHLMEEQPFYYQNGKMIKDTNVVDETKTVYKYDAKHRIIEEGYVSIDSGKYNPYTYYKYDYRGNLIAEKSATANDSNVKRYFNKYDSHGNLIEITSTNYDGSKRIETFRYDKNMNMVKEMVYKDKEFKYLREYNIEYY